MIIINITIVKQSGNQNHVDPSMTSDILINESECYDIYLPAFIISTTLLHVSVQCDWCVWQWCCMLYGISGSEAVHSGRPQWSSQCGTEPTSSPPCPDLRTVRRLTAGEAPSVWEVSVVTSHQSRSGSVLLLGKHLTSASLLLTRWCVNIVIQLFTLSAPAPRVSDIPLGESDCTLIGSFQKQSGGRAERSIWLTPTRSHQISGITSWISRKIFLFHWKYFCFIFPRKYFILSGFCHNYSQKTFNWFFQKERLM